MSRPAIEIKGLSKAYMIGHEREAMAGTMTFRDSLVNIARKPYELFTGHQLKKEKFWALKDVNLEIQQGDVVGIIGRNGSGKSTLLKVLSRIVEPTKGEVIMRGRVASLLEVGTGFHPELTGRENVYFNGAILGMTRKEIQSKFDEIVAFSEVEKFLDTPVKFYSSGMYVRLAFAVAAHLDPDILIVDEVLAVGDAAFQKKCLGKMKDVAGQGRTVLFVSHSMASVRALCTSAIVMSAGKVVFQSDDLRTAAEFYSDEGLSAGTSKWEGVVDCGDLLRLEKADLSDSIVLRGDKLNLSLSGEVKTDVGSLNVGYALYDQEGNLVYWSLSSDQQRHGLKKGRFRLSAEIPVNILNAGKYRLVIMSSLHNTKWLINPEDENIVLNFEIEGPMSSSRFWQDRRPGIIAPNLSWKNDVLSR